MKFPVAKALAALALFPLATVTPAKAASEPQGPALPPAFQSVIAGLADAYINGWLNPIAPGYFGFTPNDPALATHAFGAAFDDALDGHFSVPSHPGIVYSSDQALALNPNSFGDFVYNHLSFGPDVRNTYKGRPVTSIFVPGLNTPEPEARRRLRDQYSRILGKKMAHLHTGTRYFQPNTYFFRVDPAVAAGFEQVKSQLLAISGNCQPEISYGGLSGQPEMILEWFEADHCETFFGITGFFESNVVNAVSQIIQYQLAAANPTVVELWGYSRSTVDATSLGVVKGIKAHIAATQPDVAPEIAYAETIEALADRLVIITLGTVSPRLPRGIPQLHAYSVAPNPDPLTATVDMTLKADDAGRTVLFSFPGQVPGFDAHNAGVQTLPALRAWLDKNGYASVVELLEELGGEYEGEAGTVNDLALWQQITGELLPLNDQEVRNAIRANNGLDWIWNPQNFPTWAR